jgi:hypothetical protein
MKRLCVLFVLVPLLASPAGATFTFSGLYNTGTSLVDTTFGTDVQQDEGAFPVGVTALATNGISVGTALAQADLFSVGSVSVLALEPGMMGVAGSTAASVVSLESTTPWVLLLGGIAVVPSVPPGTAVADVSALVMDAGGTVIYTYSFSGNGPLAAQLFDPGAYGIGVRATSMVGNAEPLPDVFVLVSGAQLGAGVVAVPVPGAIGLVFCGSAGVALLRRRLRRSS